MGKIMICFMVIIMSFVTKGQQANPSPVLTKEDYLLKSKKEKTTAIVFAGVGSAMILVGGLVGIDDVGGIVDPADKDNSNLSGILVYGGLAVVAVSAPFFISSKKNKKKAAELSIKAQAFASIKNGTIVDRTVPSLSIRMPL